MLTVGPSLAWAKNKLKLSQRNANICTKIDFFDKLRLYCFIEHGDLVRDDAALELLAAIVISHEFGVGLLSASQLARLIGEIYRGGFRPNDVLKQLKKSSKTDLLRLFSMLSQVDKLSIAIRRVNGDQALLFALDVLKKNQYLPPYFKQFQRVVFENVIEFTLLEIKALNILSSLGAEITLNFSSDLECVQSQTFFAFLQEHLAPNCSIRFGRPITSSQLNLSGVAGQLLSGNKLLIEQKERLHFGVATSPQLEANWLAGQIAALKLDYGAQCSFGVGLCGNDAFALKLTRALLGHGINATYSKERPLNNSPCFNLLVSVMKARTQNIGRDLLFGVLANPGFKAGIRNLANLGRLASNLDQTGTSSDRKDVSSECGAYESAFARLLRVEKNEEIRKDLKSDQAALKKVIEIITRFPKKASLSRFLCEALQFVVEQVDENESEGKDKLVETFTAWLEVTSHVPIFVTRK